MGPIVVLSALVMVIFGVVGLVTGKAPNPDQNGVDMAIAYLPFGLVLLVMGAIVWTS